MTTHTLAEVAADMRCSGRKIRETAARLGIGVNLRGRAGWRFTDADVDAIRRALTPRPTPRRGSRVA